MELSVVLDFRYDFFGYGTCVSGEFGEISEPLYITLYHVTQMGTVTWAERSIAGQGRLGSACIQPGALLQKIEAKLQCVFEDVMHTFGAQNFCILQVCAVRHLLRYHLA